MDTEYLMYLVAFIAGVLIVEVGLYIGVEDYYIPRDTYT